MHPESFQQYLQQLADGPALVQVSCLRLLLCHVGFRVLLLLAPRPVPLPGLRRLDSRQTSRLQPARAEDVRSMRRAAKPFVGSYRRMIFGAFSLPMATAG